MAAVQKSELRRAARQLGVSYSVLVQQGGETASPERIKFIADNPPAWLVKARERREVKRFRKQRVQDRKDTAARLGIQARAVAEREIKPGDIGDLLAAPPTWLIEEQRADRHRSNARPKTSFVTTSARPWSPRFTMRGFKNSNAPPPTRRSRR